MHELSIISGIVDIATSEVCKAGAEAVDEIELDIGKLAGIELSALEFAWPEGVQGSVLEHARYKINHIPGRAICTICDTAFEMEEFFDPCPECGGFQREIIAGKEMIVKTLTIS
ncbi:MAG: hydrogenase maturation nickel metallochaperone HypA [Bacteroidia bacterium]